jgi:hypothetical protein
MLSRVATMLLCVAAVVSAADPFAGTWKVDVAKSLYRTGTPPKSMTVTIAESGNDEDTTVAVTTADGTEISYQFKKCEQCEPRLPKTARRCSRL